MTRACAWCAPAQPSSGYGLGLPFPLSPAYARHLRLRLALAGSHAARMPARPTPLRLCPQLCRDVPGVCALPRVPLLLHPPLAPPASLHTRSCIRPLRLLPPCTPDLASAPCVSGHLHNRFCRHPSRFPPPAQPILPPPPAPPASLRNRSCPRSFALAPVPSVSCLRAPPPLPAHGL
jgi:hypothetical protein